MTGDDDAISLGTCCMCGRADGVRNIIQLELRAPIAGHGWGCTVCDLPLDGAIAVICDDCLPAFAKQPAKLVIACRGYPATAPFKHKQVPH